MPTSAAAQGSIPHIEPLECRCLLSADLVGTFVSVPASLSTIANNHVSVQIVNEGDTALKGPVSVTLFASSDGSLDSSDTALAVVNRHVRIQAGQAQRFTFQFATPATVADGNDYLLARIDGGAAAAASVFASASPVTVKQPFVDLATEFVYLPGSPIRTNGIVSSKQRVALRVVNIGNTAARGTVNLDVYLAPGAVLNASAALGATWKPVHVQLKPGQSRLFAGRILLPSGTMPGSYTMFGVANASRGITTRHPADLIAAADNPLGVVSTVAAATLLDNFRRHHRHCTFYDGSDYCADTAAVYGCNDIVIAGDSVPAGFEPPTGPGPTSQPTSQPSSQPANDAWDSGLLDAIGAGNPSTDNPGANGGIDPGGDSGGSSNGGGGGSSDSGGSGSGDSGGDGGGDGGDGGDF